MVRKARVLSPMIQKVQLWNLIRRKYGQEVADKMDLEALIDPKLNYHENIEGVARAANLDLGDSNIYHNGSEADLEEAMGREEEYRYTHNPEAPAIVPVPLRPRKARVPRRKVARSPRPRKTPQEREARRQQVHAEEREDTHRLWDLAERLGTKLLEPETITALALVGGGAVGGLPLGFDLMNMVVVHRTITIGPPGSNPPEIFDCRLTVRAYILATATLPAVDITLPAILGGSSGHVTADLPAWFSPTFRMDEIVTLSYREWEASGFGNTLAEARAFESAKSKLRTLLPFVGAGILPATVIGGPKIAKAIASFTAGVIPG